MNDPNIDELISERDELQKQVIELENAVDRIYSDALWPCRDLETRYDEMAKKVSGLEGLILDMLALDPSGKFEARAFELFGDDVMVFERKKEEPTNGGNEGGN